MKNCCHVDLCPFEFSDCLEAHTIICRKHNWRTRTLVTAFTAVESNSSVFLPFVKVLQTVNKCQINISLNGV